jgi:hypothetical protein
MYKTWIGQTVVLQVEMSQMRAFLPGVIVGETDEFVRFRLAGRWEVDICKVVVVSVKGCVAGEQPIQSTSRKRPKRLYPIGEYKTNLLRSPGG